MGWLAFDTGWLLTNLFGALLLPPVIFVLPALAALGARRRWPRAALLTGVGALLLLLVFSTRAGARWLLQPLENLAPPLSLPLPDAQRAAAIVVLGGGRISAAPEYGGTDIPSLQELGRLRYAARLQRATGLPLLVTGGRPEGALESEAGVMARALREDFAVPVRWLEPDSVNTAENAEFSKALLQRAGISRVLLVTDAVHMPRAQAIFTRYGLQTVAAPTWFVGHERLSALDFVPDGEGLRRSRYAAHEWLGLLWYRLRHGSALPGTVSS